MATIKKKMDIVVSTKGTQKSKQQLGGVERSIDSMTKSLAKGVATFYSLRAAMDISKEMIRMASDAQETQSKFNTVFKGMSASVNSWAEDFADNVGRSNYEIKTFTAGMADVLKPMGLTTAAAADMSKQMVALALDVASFNNRQDEDVVRAFTSALTGERESLKTLGIVINEADVKQEAYNSGLVKMGGTLTKTAKAQATMNLLFKNSTDAQGDLARTADSYANKSKALQAEIRNSGEILGEFFLPIATQTVTALADMVENVGETADAFKLMGDEAFTSSMKADLFGMGFVEMGKQLLFGKSMIEASVIGAQNAAIEFQKKYSDVLDQIFKKRKELEDELAGAGTGGGGTGGAGGGETSAEEMLRREIEAQEQHGAHLELVNAHNDAIRQMRIEAEKEWADQRIKAQEDENATIMELLDLQNQMINEAYEDRLADAKEQTNELLSVYSDLGSELGSSVANAIKDGESVFKEAARAVLSWGLDFLEKEFLMAQASAILKSILTGGTAAPMEIAKVALGYAALEGARVAVNSYRVGTDYVQKTGPAILHEGERILTARENRNMSLGGETHNHYYIQALDSKSFEGFLRDGGNAVLEKQMVRGRLAIA